MSKIIEKEVSNVLTDEYLKYAGYVLQQRALPDSRDCLKDGARKILWSMFVNKQTCDKKPVKGNTATSGVMSYSVHGDASIYGTIMRMSQDFSLRYPLIFSDTNTGSILAGDDYAAGRYTEVKSSKISKEMLKEIEKETVDWKLNYDETKEMPKVLPALFPNICNGSTGIGVGAACSIPQFNVREVVDALINLINNPNSSFEEIYCPIDFATGGIIINENEVKESLKEGTGKAAKIRAKIIYDENKKELVVTELPYQVFTNTVTKQLAEGINQGKITQIDTFFDATNFNGVSIRMKLIKHANIKLALEELYSNSSLENYFGINMNMLEDGRKPKIYGWKEALITYISHLQEVFSRAHQFDLNKALKELEINKGYEIALAHMQEVVNLILNSTNAAEAKAKLMEDFGLNENQAKAILDLKLQRLTKLEGVEIKNKISQLEEKVNYHKEILTNKIKLNDCIIEHLNYIKNTYGDKRRTQNMNLEIEEEEIEEKEVTLYISNSGAVKTAKTNKFLNSTRGTKGAKIKWANKNDFLWKTISTTNTEKLLVFTTLGRAYVINAIDLVGEEEVYIQTILDLTDEKIMDIIPCSVLSPTNSILFITKNGFAKKTFAKEFLNSKRKTGLQAVKIKETDSIIATRVVYNESDEVIIITKQGRALKFLQSEIPNQGRTASGVIAAKLKSGDAVNDCLVVSTASEKEILIVTKNGLGKRMGTQEIPLTSRNVLGVICHNLDNGDNIASSQIVQEEDTLIVFTKSNLLQLKVKDIPTLSRRTKGVKIINVGNSIVIGTEKMEN